MAGRGNGATHETAGGAKKRNKDRQRFRKAFEQGAAEGINKTVSAAETVNPNFISEDVPDFTPRKPREHPGERQYKAGDVGGTYQYQGQKPTEPPRTANTQKLPQRTNKSIAGRDRSSAIRQAFKDMHSGEARRRREERSEERKKTIRQAFNNNPARRKRLGID